MKTQEIYYKTKLQIKQTKNNFKENLLPEIPERQEAKKKKKKVIKKKQALFYLIFKLLCLIFQKLIFYFTIQL